MATLTQARSRWVSENPIGSVKPPVDQEGYNTLADAASYVMQSQMGQEEAEASRALVRKKYRKWQSAKAFIMANGTATDKALATSLDEVIEILKADGTILDD